jgi:hypothetical protein
MIPFYDDWKTYDKDNEPKKPRRKRRDEIPDDDNDRPIIDSKEDDYIS